MLSWSRDSIGSDAFYSIMDEDTNFLFQEYEARTHRLWCGFPNTRTGSGRRRRTRCLSPGARGSDDKTKPTPQIRLNVDLTFTSVLSRVVCVVFAGRTDALCSNESRTKQYNTFELHVQMPSCWFAGKDRVVSETTAHCKFIVTCSHDKLIIAYIYMYRRRRFSLVTMI